MARVDFIEMGRDTMVEGTHDGFTSGTRVDSLRFEFLVPPNARVPVPHSHDAFDETVYGLDGVTTWNVERIMDVMRRHGLRPAL